MWDGRAPADAENDEPIAFWDMLPTLAQIAGVSELPRNDGRSVQNAFLGKAVEKAHEYLYWDYGHRDGDTIKRFGGVTGRVSVSA